MHWIVAKIRWIMLVAGALTCSMLYAVAMPSEAVDFLFDRTLENALARVFVPGWAALVGLVGGMLIYGAFVPQARMLVLSVASASKLAFLGLMLAYGRQLLDEKVSGVIALDVVMVSLFLTFMIAVRRAGRRREPVSRPATTPAPRPEPRPEPRVPQPQADAGPRPAAIRGPARPPVRAQGSRPSGT